jgi:hypothetical protein
MALPTKYVKQPLTTKSSAQYADGELRKLERSNATLYDYTVPLAESVWIFSGQYNEFFNSGYVGYVGPNGTLKFSGQMVFGTNIPNPSGVPNQPGLLLGGADGPAAAMLSTDEQVPGKDGIDLLLVAGSTGVNAGNVQAGGDLLIFGGGALEGVGGMAKLQGGTSFDGAGGPTIVSGSNSTNEGGPRGSVFIQGGENGDGGGNVELIATGGTGTDGEIKFKFNSTLLWTLTAAGSVVFGAGAQSSGDTLTSQGIGGLPLWVTKDKNAAKTATTTRTSTVTIADDPHLAITSVPTGNYQLSAFIMFGGTADAGIKFRINTNSNTGNFAVDGFANGIQVSGNAIAGNADFTIGALAGGAITGFTATGNAVIAGSTWNKTGGGVAFDSAIYSDGNTNNSRISCSPNTTTLRFLIGLSTSQGLHASITRSFFFNSDNHCYIFEAGGSVADLGTFLTSDVFEITYDGANVRYYKNSVLQHTTATTGNLYADSSFVDPSAQADNVSYSVFQSTNDQWVKIDGLLEISSSGNVALAWAQNVSDAGGTSILKGFLTLRRM